MNAVLDTSIMCTVDGPTWKPTTDKDASFLNAAAASEQHPGSRSQNLPPSPFQLRSTVSPMWLWLHVANVSIRDSRHFPFFLLTKITKCVKLTSVFVLPPRLKARKMFKCSWLPHALLIWCNWLSWGGRHVFTYKKQLPQQHLMPTYNFPETRYDWSLSFRSAPLSHRPLKSCPRSVNSVN